MPLTKKDSGIRPLVVGECLRAIIAKAAGEQVAEEATALQPLHIGIGGRGPWMQASVVCSEVVDPRSAARGGHT